MNIPRSSIRFAIALLIAVLAAPVRAQPADPAGLFPEDTLFYLARMGSDHVKPAVADTSWGRLLKEPEVERFCKSTGAALEQLVATQSGGDEDVVAIYRTATDALKVLERRPTAFAILDARISDEGPAVEAALVCLAGDAAADLVKKFDQLQQLTGAPEGEVALVAGHSLTRIPAPMPVFYGEIKGTFLVALGENTVKTIAKRLNAGSGEKSLADNAALKLSRERIGGDAASRSWTFYLDMAAALNRLRPALPMITDGDQEAVATIESFITAFGLDSVKSVCWEMHYRADGVVSGIFHHTPDGGRGLFASETSPLTDADLALIPKSPSWAAAFEFDVAALYRGILFIIKSLDSETHNAVMGGIAEFEEALGFRIDDDFLSLFGDTLVVYDTPDSGGFWFSGMTAIITVKDGDKLRKHARKILKAVDDLAPDEGLSGKFQCKVGKLKHRGHTIEFVNLTGIPMPLAPAWTLHEGRFIMAFYPQMIITTLDRLMDGDPKANSILANADVVKARKVLGESGVSFSYVDSRAGVASVYPLVLPLAQVGAAMAQGYGVEIDITALPSLSTLQRHLYADVGSSRSDAQGTLSLTYGSWPIPSTPSMSGGVAASALGASVLLPSLSRARELSKRTLCASNMHGIAQALYISAQDTDKFPTDIRDLIKENNSTFKQFICPSTAVDVHDVEEAIDACYIYIPGQSTTSDPTNVLLYERFENHRGEGANVLFLDGHVEFIKDLDKVEELVQKTKDRIAAVSRKGKDAGERRDTEEDDDEADVEDSQPDDD